MTTKRKDTSSKYNAALRIYGPRRFGYDNIEVVRCFVCGFKQVRTDPSRHHIKGMRLVEVHHIYPYIHYPELNREPNNYVFLCVTHHRQFHNLYDTIILGPRAKKNSKPMNITRPASAEDFAMFLNITAKETIAIQHNWSQEDRRYARVTDSPMRVFNKNNNCLMRDDNLS